MEIKRFKHMYSHLNLTKFLKELPKIPQKNPRFLESKVAVADVIASWVLGFLDFQRLIYVGTETCFKKFRKTQSFFNQNPWIWIP